MGVEEFVKVGLPTQNKRSVRIMTTYLTYLPIDMRKFNRWAGQRGLIRKGIYDQGYAMHVLLCNLFGKNKLQPFRIFASEHQRYGSLYAYSEMDASRLAHEANLYATPDCLSATQSLRGLQSKEMPTNFPTSQKLGFEIRIRPTRRLAQNLSDPKSGKCFAKGAELDVYVAYVLRQLSGHPNSDEDSLKSAGITRYSCYVDWLSERFSDSVDVLKNDCRLTSFKRTRCVRGSGPNIEGPDVIIHGNLKVKEPDSFNHKIRNGLGRHKAYGYGMLLLRPPTGGR